MNKIAFFDRDGVLNRDDKGYVYRPEDCILMPGAAQATRILKDQGWTLVVVTNQSGVARGYYSEDDVHAFHRQLNTNLVKMGGAPIDRFYHCPHHPTAGTGALTRQCDCRKPAPGMILDGLAYYHTDPAQCMLFGDKDSDVEAGEKAGVTSFKYTVGELDKLVLLALDTL